jgi:histidinol-phosphatase (PHP family)
VLPADGHVHTEWSWDTDVGSMERSCERALALGLESIAFTDHADFTRWLIPPEIKARMDAVEAALVDGDGRFSPPPLQADAYLACVQRCRDRFPGLHILSGLELGEPHWHTVQVNALLGAGRIDRPLGSVHSIALEDPWMVDHLFGRIAPADLMRAYLDEVFRLVSSSAEFAVLAHIDYPARHWPLQASPFDAAAFEDEYRAVLAALARSGRALEVNTRVPLPAAIVRWWFEAGGQALSFGSDAHRPADVAHEFSTAAALAESCGFRPGRYPHDFWRRHP